MPAAEKVVTDSDDLDHRPGIAPIVGSTPYADGFFPQVTTKKTKGKKKLKNKAVNISSGLAETSEDTVALKNGVSSGSPHDDLSRPTSSPKELGVTPSEEWSAASTSPPKDDNLPAENLKHALLDVAIDPEDAETKTSITSSDPPIDAPKTAKSADLLWQESARIMTNPQPVMNNPWLGTSGSPSSGDDLGVRLSPIIGAAPRPLHIHLPESESPKPTKEPPNVQPIDVKARAPRPKSFPRSTPPYVQRHDMRTQAVPFSTPLDAPPPHRMQSHFFTLPDIGLGLSSKPEQGKLAGSCGYCCSFDSFTESGEPTSAKHARDVLLVGSEGGLDVYRVAPDKFEVIGRLEGLRGAVIGAKVLPQSHESNFPTPLLAVVIYGPADDKSTKSAVPDEEPMRNSHRLFQTTVEIYSLANQKHISTLYQGLPMPFQAQTIDSASSRFNDPERFSIDANGKFITIASAKSGEIWIFSTTTVHDSGPAFRCLGKLWTAIQTTHDTSRSQNTADKSSANVEKRLGSPMFSLSSRWLAVVPPYTSAGITIQGSPVMQEEDSQIPGLNTQLAPIQPLVTCEVAGIDAEGTLSWLSRKAAQGLVKASQKGYEMGLQGWKELTNPSPSNATSSNPVINYGGDLFPPTNGPANDPRRLAKEPALVSIYDLEMLLDARDHHYSQLPSPLATFALVDGCNHLSFSPDGTKLLTTDRTGEVSTAWDLQHISHGKVKYDAVRDSAFERGPHVRQIHRLVRSTPSTVIGSVWSRDGDKLALLTTHGTIHMHDIPLRMSIQKKHRKPINNQVETSEKAEATVSVSQGVSPPSSNSFWNTFRSGMQSVGAQVNTIRSRSTGMPITFAGFREVTAAAGQAGGRAVAKGLTHGYAAAKEGASDIWHSEDNKIRQKALQDVSDGKAFMRWIDRRGETFLAVSSAGKVHVYPVQQEIRRKGSVNVTGLRKFPPNNFTLPRITTREEMNVCAGQGPHGFWILQPTGDHGTRTSDRRGLGSQTTELESNPPYCPFHIDSRVSIFAFEDGPNASQVYDGTGLPWHLKGHGISEEPAWTFGESLPPSTRMNDHADFDMEELNAAPPLRSDGVEELVESKITVRSAHHGGGFDEHIRLNTRRTRNLGTTTSDEHVDMASEENESRDIL